MLFTCYNLGKRYVLYDTYTKEVLKTEWISEHCGSKIEYGVPFPLPSKDYLETGVPSLFGLRDAKGLFIIDVREDGETHLLGTNIMAGFGLSKVFVDYTFTIQEENKDQLEPKADVKQLTLYTTTWYQGDEQNQWSQSRVLNRELIQVKLTIR